MLYSDENNYKSNEINDRNDKRIQLENEANKDNKNGMLLNTENE